MADRDIDHVIAPSGDVSAVVNPIRSTARGVEVEQSIIQVRLDETGLSCRLTGVASYRGRTASVTVDVPRDELGERLEATLRRVLSDHLDDLEARALESGYEAAIVARRKGE